MLLVYLHGISGAQNCVDEGGELVYDDWCDGPVTVQNVATDRMTSFISLLEKRSWGIALLGIFPCPSPCNIVHKRKKKRGRCAPSCVVCFFGWVGDWGRFLSST